MADQEKPFKSIEVLDVRTAELCKIACMSCIRGHRTTSCGIPVCRNKIFWTVKRPGRPATSCSCRYGATGGCKCVVARSACPHKTKKGEKRSGECRCDEQGRYCCVLDPQHWTELFALRKPRVHFFPNREALEATQADSPANFSNGIPSTPSFSHPFTPPPYGSIPRTPHLQHMTPDSMSMKSSRTSSLTPRFNMMGIGAPQGNEGVITPNVLSWQGQAPPVAEPYPLPSLYQSQQHQQPFQPQQPIQQPQQEESSCCGSSSTPVSQPQPQQHICPGSGPMNTFGSIPAYTMPENPATLAYNKMTSDYFAYQLPNAICQNCGLNGCTCRNCPPVMQNFATGSWAQCCGRKHARTDDPPQLPQQPVPKKTPTESDFASPTFQQQQPLFTTGEYDVLPGVDEIHANGGMPHFDEFELDPDFGLPDDLNMDLSDMLMSDLNRPPEVEEAPGNTAGCCCDPNR